jgi:hypothetical protein
MKARIEIVGEDLKKVVEALRQLGENISTHQGRP